MEARCIMCGGPAEHLAVDKDHWVPMKPAYRNAMRRFLCFSCKRLYSPAVIVDLEKGDKRALRALPLEDSKGDLLPTIFKKQIEAHPQFFPLRHLCEKQLRGTIQAIYDCIDCRIVKLYIPFSGDYWVEFHTLERGYIYSCIQPWVRLEPGDTVSFEGFYAENDRYVCRVKQR